MEELCKRGDHKFYGEIYNYGNSSNGKRKREETNLLTTLLLAISKH